MLRNNADTRRCSYFELGPPVLERAVFRGVCGEISSYKKMLSGPTLTYSPPIIPVIPPVIRHIMQHSLFNFCHKFRTKMANFHLRKKFFQTELMVKKSRK